MGDLHIEVLNQAVFEWPRLKIRRPERDMFVFFHWRNPSWLRLDPSTIEIIEVNTARKLKAINN